MDLISSYDRLNVQQMSGYGKLASDREALSTTIKQQSIRKLIQTFAARFRFLSITFLEPQIINHNRTSTLETPSSISFSLLVESTTPGYDYIFHISLGLKGLNTFKIVAMVLKNGLLITSQKQNAFQLVARYCLEINKRSSQSNRTLLFSLRVNPVDGVFKLIFMNHLSANQVNDYIKKPIEFHDRIKNHVKEAAALLNTEIMGRILFIYNDLTMANVMPPSGVLTQKNSIHPFFTLATCPVFNQLNEKLRSISKQIIHSHLEYPFLFKQSPIAINFRPIINPRIINKKQEQFNRALATLSFNNKTMALSPAIQDLISKYTPIHYEYELGIMEKFTEKEVLEIQKMNKCDASVSGSKQILSDIIVHEIESETHYTRGGFGELSKIVMKYSLVNEENASIADGGEYSRKNIPQIRQSHVMNAESVVSRTLMKKTAEKGKMWWEKTIINKIGKGKCIFINQYYNAEVDASNPELKDLSFQDHLFMEYCPSKSLTVFLSSYGSITSLQMKIFYLYQVTMALRFLRDYNIVHLDLKPENLLVKQCGNYFLLKLIDFGESFSETEQHIGIQRGFSLPYASPQLLKREPKHHFSEKSDVFSLGAMILVIIFEINTTEIKRIGTKPFTDADYAKLYSICFEKCRILGFEPVLLLLLNLAYKCIKPIRSQRPLLDWICVIIKSCLSILEALWK